MAEQWAIQARKERRELSCVSSWSVLTERIHHASSRGGFFFFACADPAGTKPLFSPLMPFLAALLNCGFFREQTLNETRKFQYDTNIKNLTL